MLGACHSQVYRRHEKLHVPSPHQSNSGRIRTNQLSRLSGSALLADTATTRCFEKDRRPSRYLLPALTTQILAGIKIDPASCPITTTMASTRRMLQSIEHLGHFKRRAFDVPYFDDLAVTATVSTCTA